jgi:hypothetical protein
MSVVNDLFILLHFLDGFQHIHRDPFERKKEKRPAGMQLYILNFHEGTFDSRAALVIMSLKIGFFSRE